MSDTETEEAAETVGNPKLAWTIKGQPAERREAIKLAAHRKQQTVAEYIWATHLAYEASGRQFPVPLRRAALVETRPTPEQTVGVAELFALVIDLARVEQTAGNKALLGRARAVLSYRLDALRAPRPPRTRKSDTSDTSDIEASA